MDNILIIASGTGGHVYPGIALAYELKDSGYNPVFVVNDVANSVSLNIVRNSGYDYKLLNFYAPPRKISIKLFLCPFNFIKSIFKANAIINKINPKAVIGMGAYLSVPVLIVAKFKKIPTMIHEQNSIPGIANKLLSKFVDKIAVSFKNSLKYFCPLKTVYTSNPVRKDIFDIPRKEACKKLNISNGVFTVFIFGGSLGAVKLNNIVFNIAKQLYDKYQDKIQFIHITGIKYFEEIKNKYDVLPYKKYIVPYMHDIGNAYACSDLVICRAGAGTVKEVEMYGIKAIFIPFPFATDNHQYFNAKNIEKNDFIDVIEEKNLKEEQLIEIIEKNMNNQIDEDRLISPRIFPQKQLLNEVLKLIK
ncbi:MAG: undecaprenyldiphospho-muramoylpentapeptide beta-N-acetylglucosaminyltransferase [Endomicrobiaceae bacterium]|nr:undecaprenyldiphospho-muramoylpentapeptide beta-N-acetylglucosaminyltransferase [Endomicrobiaceae bacterium]